MNSSANSRGEERNASSSRLRMARKTDDEIGDAINLCRGGMKLPDLRGERLQLSYGFILKNQKQA